MIPRGPKRIYSRKALEAWFENLAESWESQFPTELLERGRELYREGEVREIEMSEKDAIIHARREKADAYAFLEWQGGKLNVRHSTEDKVFGFSLAVAGLYEIEELVADECTGLDVNEARSEASAPTIPARENNVEEENRPARPLTVHLTAHKDGLFLDGFWGHPTDNPLPAFGEQPPEAPKITATEREKLIRLTRRAHQSGFRATPKGNRYLLADLDRLPAFVKDELPVWKRYFLLNVSPQVQLLAKGPQKLKTDVEASEGESGLRFNCTLRVGDRTLPPSLLSNLFSTSTKRIALVPEIGLLKIDETQAELLEQLGPYLQNGHSSIPYYMVFSLFGQEASHLRLSPSVSRWKEKLLDEPGPNGHLPDFLRPYQKRGVLWLSHLSKHDCHGLLADEMGLGKTVQILALLDDFRRKHASENPKPCLIVCPASVVPVWEGELRRFFPHLRAEVLKGASYETTTGDTDLWIASYTQLRRHKDWLAKAQFFFAVLDEAQFIKNPDAKITQACMAIRATHRLALTGTPLENRHLDLWTIFRFLMPGLLGGRKSVVELAAKDTLTLSHRIRQQIAPFVLRRTKKEVITELPPKIESTLICPLTPLQQREYARLALQGVEQLGDNLSQAVKERAISLFTLLTRLRQVCCDPSLLPWQKTAPNSSGKINTLVERLREILDSGHKVVIFSQFVSLLQNVKQALATEFPATPLYELTGKTLNRSEPVRLFQETPGAGVILVSLKAGGTGITLHAADYVFLLDPWWNPAVEAQAIDRVHRIGQEKTVFVYRMITHGTIEERIEALKQSKRDLFDGVMDGLETGDTFERNFKSLHELINLTAEADPDPNTD